MTTLAGGNRLGTGSHATPSALVAFLFVLTRGGGGRTKRPTAARAGAALRMPTAAGVAV